jgi:hypothetical protein
MAETVVVATEEAAAVAGRIAGAVAGDVDVGRVADRRDQTVADQVVVTVVVLRHCRCRVRQQTTASE